MSYQEAIADNIHFEKNREGFTMYYPPCKVCGCPVPAWKYISGMQYACSECRKLLVEQMRIEKDEQQADKKQKRFEAAVKRISKVAKIERYQSAIECVHKKLYTHGWFQSTEEIMVAIELVKCKIKAHHQVRIYDYSVDFILPEFKVALEIDGKPFHSKENQNKQQIRDEAIVDKLGAGWNIIHIDTDNINLNVTKLIPAIKAVLKHRKNKHSCSLNFTPTSY